MKSYPQKFRQPTPTLLACALASCLLISAPAAFAQSTSATLRGQVSVDAAPAADARITATNVDTGLSRTAQSAANGSYNLNGLPPGTYRIDVNAGGKTSSKNVVLQVGQTATMDLGVGGAAAPTALGTVVVTGASLVETKTSEVATYVTQKQIESLPQISRNFLAFADIVPGVVFSTDANNGSTKLRGGGQGSNGINVYIDGVGQKNYVLKGGVTGQDSSRGNPFPQFGIAEYKVITSNYKAEFDQVSSAAVVAVTRSGTNEFNGDVFYDYTDQDWRQPTEREERNDAITPSTDKQFGIAFGGPIIQDRMHFFVTYEAKERTDPREISLGENVPISRLPSDLAALASATTGAPFQEDLYFGKLDWEPGDNHLFELTAKYRKEDELTNVGGRNTASYGTLKAGDDTRIDLRYQYNAEHWLNDAHLTYEDATFGPRPATIGPGYQLTLFNPWQVILNSGGGPDFQDKGQTGYSFQDDLTFTDFDWHGGHTIKTGLKYKAVEVSAFQQQPYNPQFSYDINNSLTVPYRVEFGAVTGGGSGQISSRNKQFGIYLQDDWEVNDHLLLNLGLRWDYEQAPGYLNYVTPAPLVAALRGWSNLHQPGVDYNIEDFISDGSNRKAFKDAWQPRLGFSYDFNADQRHVLFGGIGRSYDRNLFDYLAQERLQRAFPRYSRRFNSPGHPCTVGVGDCLAFNPGYYDPATLAALVTANPALGGEVWLINNDLKTPYSDQFSLGMRNTITLAGNDWNSSVTIARINSYDGIVLTLGNRRPDGLYRPPGTTWGNSPWGFGIPGYGTLIVANNGIETKLTTLLFSLDKPYTKDSGWGLTLAYTFNDASENHAQAYQQDDAFVGDYPSLEGIDFTRTLDLSRHRLVATGIIDGWFGISFTGKLTLASPTPKFSINCHALGFNDCFFDPFTPGYAIGYKQFDLSAQKEWEFGNDMKFRLRGDVVNAFNWRNWTDYDTWRGGPLPDFNPTFGQRSDIGIAYPTRIFKLSAGFSW